MGSKKKYSDDDLIEIVRLEFLQNNGKLTSAGYHKLGRKPSLSVLLNRLGGSWESVCNRAGIPFTPGRASHNNYTNEEIIEALRFADQQIDGPLTYEAYIRLGVRPYGSWIAARFGTWKLACQAAGVQATGYTRTKMDLISILKNTLTKLGYVPRIKDFKGPPSLPALRNIGIYYKEAVELAGFDYRLSTRDKTLITIEVAREIEMETMDKETIRIWIQKNLVMQDEAREITEQSKSGFNQSVATRNLLPFVEFGDSRKTRLYLREDLDHYAKNKRIRGAKMKKFEDLNVTNSTIIEVDGKELRTTQDPYAADDETYRAHAVDEENNEYLIEWEVIDDETTDESEACDWDHPLSVKAI